MLFWLKKALTLPFLPLHFALFVGTVGLFLSWRRSSARLGLVLMTVALLSLLVFSNARVATALVVPLESSYAPMPEARSAGDLPAELKDCTAVVVLGGGHTDHTSVSRVSQLSPAALARLTEGIRLARLLPKAKLIVSGNNGADISHAQVLAEAAESLGFAAERIVRMDEPRDTEDEAAGIKQRIGSAPFALVTSAWHMPRAMTLCRRAALNPVACPTDFIVRPGSKIPFAWLRWDIGQLEASTWVMHERVGLLWIRVRSALGRDSR
jgi:uncharacterized SAM-binding protein YcdF (DUF218 family)